MVPPPLGPLAAPGAAVKMPHRHIAAAVQVERPAILLAALPVRLEERLPVRLELIAIARLRVLAVVAVRQMALPLRLAMAALAGFRVVLARVAALD